MPVEGSPFPVIALNEGGTFSALNPSDVLAGARAATDMDGDGSVDLVHWHRFASTAGAVSYFVSVARNDGAGRFAVVHAQRLDHEPLELFAGDADADRDADVLVVGRQAEAGVLVVLANDGRGQLRVTTVQSVFVGSAGSRPQSKVAADFDADGDVDIAWLDDFNAIVLDNRRAGGFVPVPVPGVVQPATSVTAFDFERDGLPELLIADFTGPRLFANRGGMRFTENAGLIVSPLPGTRRAVIAPTVSGTPAFLMWSVNEPPGVPTLRVHAFDGTRFVPAGDAAIGAQFEHVIELRAVALEGQGSEPRAVLSSAFGLRVFAGTVDVTVSMLGAFALASGAIPLFADLDTDGDVDAPWYRPGAPADHRLLRGIRRQTHAPFGAHRGFEWSLYFVGVDTRAEVLLLGVVPAIVPTPFGVLRMDPTQALFLPLGGASGVHFTVPSDQALTGVPLLAQTLSPSGGTWVLSNLERRRIH